MKSVAIFLCLVFLTGFQAAVLSEETPPPSTPEPNQSLLEQMQEQFQKISTQVTNSVNDGLGAIKESASNIMTYAADVAKKTNMQKLGRMKMATIAKEIQSYSSTVYNQGVETLKDQYKKAVEVVGEMKKYPAAVMLSEEVIQPFNNKCQKVLTWAGEQTTIGLLNMVHKKLGL